jgi:hypothetical protein
MVALTQLINFGPPTGLIFVKPLFGLMDIVRKLG